MANYLNVVADVDLTYRDNSWVLGPGQVAPVLWKRKYAIKLHLYHVVETSVAGRPAAFMGRGLSWPNTSGPRYADADYAKHIVRDISTSETICGVDIDPITTAIQAEKAFNLLMEATPTMYRGGLPSVFKRSWRGTRELFDVYSNKMVRCEKVADYNPVNPYKIWPGEGFDLARKASQALGKDLLIGWDEVDPSKVVNYRLTREEFKRHLAAGVFKRVARKIKLHGTNTKGQDEALQMEFYEDTVRMLRSIGCGPDVDLL